MLPHKVAVLAKEYVFEKITSLLKTFKTNRQKKLESIRSLTRFLALSVEACKSYRHHKSINLLIKVSKLYSVGICERAFRVYVFIVSVFVTTRIID